MKWLELSLELLGSGVIGYWLSIYFSGYFRESVRYAMANQMNEQRLRISELESTVISQGHKIMDLQIALLAE